MEERYGSPKNTEGRRERVDGGEKKKFYVVISKTPLRETKDSTDDDS